MRILTRLSVPITAFTQPQVPWLMEAQLLSRLPWLRNKKFLVGNVEDEGAVELFNFEQKLSNYRPLNPDSSEDFPNMEMELKNVLSAFQLDGAYDVSFSYMASTLLSP